MQEKYLAKKLSLFFAFVDLEKAFDRVPRSVIWWAMRKLGIDEWIIKRIRCAWGKFRELLPLLTCRSLSFITRGRMFDIYIRKVMLHASECWALTSVDHARLQRTDRSMIRWICNVKWEDNRSSESLLEQLQIPSITSVLSCNRLRWYGHVERDTGCIHDALYMEVPGTKPPGRPKKTWLQTVKKDIKDLRMSPDASDRLSWRSKMKKSMRSCNPHLRGKEAR